MRHISSLDSVTHYHNIGIIVSSSGCFDVGGHQSHRLFIDIFNNPINRKVRLYLLIFLSYISNGVDNSDNTDP